MKVTGKVTFNREANFVQSFMTFKGMDTGQFFKLVSVLNHRKSSAFSWSVSYYDSFKCQAILLAKKLQMTTSTLRTELSKGLYFVALNSTVQDVFTMQHGLNIFLQSNIFLKLEKLFRSSSAAGGGVDQYNSKIIVSNKLASITFASPPPAAALVSCRCLYN